MNEALISGLAAIIVCMVNNLFQQRIADKKQSEAVSLIEYRIDELSARVEKHNNIIDRTYELEKHAALLEEDIKVANHRIKDLEQKG